MANKTYITKTQINDIVNWRLYNWTFEEPPTPQKLLEEVVNEYKQKGIEVIE